MGRSAAAAAAAAAAATGDVPYTLSEHLLVSFSLAHRYYYLVLGININLEQRADNSSTYILPGTGYEATKQKPYVKKGKKNDPPNRGRREQTKRKTNRNAKKGFQPLRTYTVKEPCNTTIPT